jgi:3D (Asp-Asp-Asp) domain-containing protein
VPSGSAWGRILLGGAVIACAVLALGVVRTAGSAAGVASRASGCPPPRTPPRVTLVRRPRWVANVLITEYFPAPERWFDGRLVSAPGLPGRHRIDWLYSARGLAMQGEGVGTDGRFYHFAGPYSLTWRNAFGGRTLPCTRAPGYWTNGRPTWIGPTWLDGAGRVTYPLPGGRWSAGRPVQTKRPAASAVFARGRSLSLRYWHDVAVDPRFIAYGSRIFVPAYCSTPSHGWLTAADTGGAILGPHIDVFRAPPSRPWASQALRGQRIFVVPPGHAAPSGVRC